MPMLRIPHEIANSIATDYLGQKKKACMLAAKQPKHQQQQDQRCQGLALLLPSASRPGNFGKVWRFFQDGILP